jgi:hypothetical protein
MALNPYKLQGMEGIGDGFLAENLRLLSFIKDFK